MKYSTFQFDYRDLNVNLNEIERVLGYEEGNDRAIVNATIEEILNERDLFDGIRAEYKVFNPVEFIDSDKSLTIDNINFQIHKIIFGQLRKSDSVAVFLVTAGEEPGRRSRKAMSEGDPVRGYIYDMFGSLVVDAAAQLAIGKFEKAISASGKKITNLFSPGYCGWDVAEQHKLFRLIPGNFCGIRLTDSALMDPVKSISGIIGIGEKVRFYENSCNFCEMKDCAFRKV